MIFKYLFTEIILREVVIIDFNAQEMDTQKCIFNIPVSYLYHILVLSILRKYGC